MLLKNERRPSEIVSPEDGAGGLYIEVLDLFAELFDEFSPRLDDVAHEDAEEFVGFDGVLHLDAVDDAVFRVHRRLP